MVLLVKLCALSMLDTKPPSPPLLDIYHLSCGCICVGVYVWVCMWGGGVIMCAHVYKLHYIKLKAMLINVSTSPRLR